MSSLIHLEAFRKWQHHFLDRRKAFDVAGAKLCSTGVAFLPKKRGKRKESKCWHFGGSVMGEPCPARVRSPSAGWKSALPCKKYRDVRVLVHRIIQHTISQTAAVRHLLSFHCTFENNTFKTQLYKNYFLNKAKSQLPKYNGLRLFYSFYLAVHYFELEADFRILLTKDSIQNCLKLPIWR